MAMWQWGQGPGGGPKESAVRGVMGEHRCDCGLATGSGTMSRRRRASGRGRAARRTAAQAEVRRMEQTNEQSDETGGRTRPKHRKRHPNSRKRKRTQRADNQANKRSSKRSSLSRRRLAGRLGREHRKLAGVLVAVRIREPPGAVRPARSRQPCNAQRCRPATHGQQRTTACSMQQTTA